jgi:hypothetical protein
MPYLGNAPFEGTISSNSIADGSITTSKIQDTAVTNSKLSSTAVGSSNLVDGSVTSAKLDTNISIAGTLTVTGNLTVNGTTTTVNSTTVTIDDPIFTLGGDAAPSVDDSKDRGIEFRWHNGTTAKVGFFGFDRSSQKLMFIPDASNTSEVFSGSLGIIDVSAVHINGSAMTTSNIAEGTNLYYTDARARASVSFSAGSGGYNSSTGVITIPTNTNQLTNGAGFANTGKAIAMALVFGG